MHWSRRPDSHIFLNHSQLKFLLRWHNLLAPGFLAINARGFAVPGTTGGEPQRWGRPVGLRRPRCVTIHNTHRSYFRPPSLLVLGRNFEFFGIFPLESADGAFRTHPLLLVSTARGTPVRQRCRTWLVR